jgi:hypothetical protein
MDQIKKKNLLKVISYLKITKAKINKLYWILFKKKK